MSDDLFGDVFSLPTPSIPAAPLAPAPSRRPSAVPTGSSVAAPVESETALVDVVRELRARQREIEAEVQRTSRKIDAAERQSLHRAAGFDTMELFLDRTLGEPSVLRVLLSRGSRPTKPRAAKRGAGRAAKRPPEEPDARSDAAFARACVFVRAVRDVEQALRAQLREADRLLRRVERDRLFVEASYGSYEDFLDRAVGPSPVFGPTLLMLVMLGDELGEEPVEAPSASEAPGRTTMEVAPYDLLASMSPAPPDAGAPPPSSSAARSSPAPVAHALAPSVPRPAPRLSMWLAVSVSAIVAVAVGSIAGVFASRGDVGRGQAEAVAPAAAHASAAPSTSAEHPASAPPASSSTTKHATAEQATPPSPLPGFQLVEN